MANTGEDESAVLGADKNACRDLANQLIAFGETEPVSFMLKWWGYDPVVASLDLLRFANQLGTVEDDRLNNMAEVLRSLRIRSGAFTKHPGPKEL